MQSLDINQLQFKELAKTISAKSNYNGLKLKDNEKKFLLEKTTELLSGLKRIIITDRKQVRSDGYFVLDISLEGFRLLKSKSVVRSEYTYRFDSNEFKLNQKTIDVSFLDQFLQFIDKISTQLPLGHFEVIEEG